MKRARLILGFLILGAVPDIASPLRAQIINGGFEEGISPGWAVNYEPLVTTASWQPPLGYGLGDPLAGWFPTEGNKFAYLLSGLAVNGEHLPTKMAQMFYLTEGNRLSFDVFFDAGDYLPYKDWGRATISGGGSENQLLFYASVATVGDYGAVGWENISFTAPASGLYKLFFEVSNHSFYNMIPDWRPSALGVDNVSWVPEPTTAGMLLVGLLLGLIRRRG